MILKIVMLGFIIIIISLEYPTAERIANEIINSSFSLALCFFLYHITFSISSYHLTQGLLKFCRPSLSQVCRNTFLVFN